LTLLHIYVLVDKNQSIQRMDVMTGKD